MATRELRSRLRPAPEKDLVPPIDRRDGYAGLEALAGSTTHRAPASERVVFRSIAGPRREAVLRLIVAANAVAALAFLGWLLLPSHIPGLGRAPSLRTLIGQGGFVLIVVVESLRLTQALGLWVFARNMRHPIPLTPPRGLRVAVLTTIVPSKEPLEMVEETLRAMRRIRYPGRVDVWILDEGDDPRVRRMAAELGVRHFSRKGLPQYNRSEGPYRARTKAGNHNAWRAEHESAYDVVAQMDPDHVPVPEFLERTLGYFRDPDVAFVVAPQVYGNAEEGFVPRAAGAQAYLFHGVVQAGGNGLDAPLLIGTNHLYRTRTWRQIGGYQDSVIEDHLTSMVVHGTVNLKTGNRWKGVYTPDILAVGEGPATWSDYFRQQKRWAYGVWEVLLRHAPRLMPRLSRRQRLAYSLLQFFYPSVAALWLLGSLVTGAYLAFGITSLWVGLPWWLLLWGTTVVAHLWLFLWLRRFNLAPHERRELGLNGVLLTLLTGPVYVVAAVAALFRRPLSYQVTAKGDQVNPDSLRTFRPHLAWIAAAASTLAWSFAAGHSFVALRGWALVTLTASVLPILIHAKRKRRSVDLAR